MALTALLLAACGRTSSDPSPPTAPDAPPGDTQELVPAVLQRPDLRRYFVVNDEARRLELIEFQRPSAPRVVDLGQTGYRAARTSFSPSGRRFAYGLSATELTPAPFNQLWVADAEDDFAPTRIEGASLSDPLFQLAWIGERALLTVNAALTEEGRVYRSAYSWIDLDTLEVTELSRLPPRATDGSGAQAPSSVLLEANEAGVLYVDERCDLVFLSAPWLSQRLLNDCHARAEWSGDGSFVLVTSEAGRDIYELVGTELWPSPELSSALAAFPTAKFRWAPRAPRFVLTVGGEALGVPVAALSYGDARARTLVAFPDLPDVNDVGLLTDDLLVASNWSGERYVWGVPASTSSATPSLRPLGLSDVTGASLVSSSDSSRLYYPRDPLLTIALEQGQPVAREELFDAPHPVERAQFRLLDSDEAGLLTLHEANRGAPGAAVAKTHQYLLGLGREASVIGLGSFDLAVGTTAEGIATFQSAPQLGGILYVGTTAGGRFVDWLGFDDIGRKARLLETTAANLHLSVPPVVAYE